MKLPRLSNAEFDLANSRISASGENPLQCPTCKSMPDSEDDGLRIHGIYRYQGKDNECDCETQIALRRHYALANIPKQYMTLDWATYDGDQYVKDEVANYIEKFIYYKDNGLGIEFYSPEFGVGKTFAAIHIGKELVKQGYSVYFLAFPDLVNRLSTPETAQDTQEFLEKAHVIIIDDITPGISEKQRDLFASKLELVVRHRTNWNMPTVITTNLLHEDLLFFYPRIYSLLSAKHQQVKMPGKDRRPGLIKDENERLARNCETKPIT